jgi:hypothetical protein
MRRTSWVVWRLTIDSFQEEMHYALLVLVRRSVKMCRVQKGKELNDFQRNLLDIEILSNLRFGSLEIRDTSVTRVTSILRKPAHLPNQVLIRPNVSVLERILNRKVCIHLAARVDEFRRRWFRRKGCQGKRINSDSVARHRLYSTQQSLTQSMRLYSGSKT